MSKEATAAYDGLTQDEKNGYVIVDKVRKTMPLWAGGKPVEVTRILLRNGIVRETKNNTGWATIGSLSREAFRDLAKGGGWATLDVGTAGL